MKSLISKTSTRNTIAVIFTVIFVISIIVAVYYNFDNHLANIFSIISPLISVYFYFYKNEKNLDNSDNPIIPPDYEKMKIKHTVDFEKLYDTLVNEQRIKEVGDIIQELEQYFQIDIYEIQIEDKPIKGGERMLSTLCSSYKSPESTPVRNENGDYSGQTTYAFIKNRTMWITAGGRKLIDGVGHYVDEWSNTKPKEIPEFWNIAPTSKDVFTSVIIPLRFPNMETDFGFIDFESTKYHSIQNNSNARKIDKLFQEIADIFAKDYVEKLLSK